MKQDKNPINRPILLLFKTNQYEKPNFNFSDIYRLYIGYYAYNRCNGTDFIAQYAHIIDKELGIWNPYFGIYDYRTNSYAIHCCPKGLYLNCQKGMCSMITDLFQCYPPNTYPLE